MTVIAAIGLVSAITAPPSTPQERRTNWVPLGLGALSGGGFALLFIALDQAGTRAGAWPLPPSQGIAVVLIVVLAIVAGHRPTRLWRRVAGPAITTGVAGAGATLLFLAATASAPFAVTAVITSLYPATTVLLARVVLGERWTRPQVAGLVASLVGVVLLALS